MNTGHLIAPSILAADFCNLQEAFDMINDSEADWFHVDVMDGSFVPNISFGLSLMPFFKKMAKKPLDVHLMIDKPENYVEAFIEQGADIVTVHLEACKHAHRVIQQIKGAGAKAGIALNPHSNISLIEDILEDVDLILIMSVNPGFGGQKFIYRTINKIQQLKIMCEQRNLRPLIEVDGGVGLQNAEAVLKAGANVLVAGSSVFKAANPSDAIARLKNIEPNKIIL